VRARGPRHAHLGVFKNFRVGERVDIQFRGELLNLTNTPQYNPPNTALGSATFGQVTGASQFMGPRQVQLGLKVSF
jgi:hypothetical protein